MNSTVKALFRAVSTESIEDIRSDIFEIAMEIEKKDGSSLRNNVDVQLDPFENGETRMIESKEFKAIINDLSNKSKSTSPVCAISDKGIMIFKSIYEASKQLKIQSSDIKYCCDGVQKTALGMKFSYVFNNLQENSK